MSGPYTKLLGVTSSGPILYPDEIMDAGTLSVIDFMDAYTWPNETYATPLSTSADYKQFDARQADFLGPPVKVNYPFVIYTPVIFDGTKGRNILLPDCWKLGTGMKHFAMAFWFQLGPTIPNGFSNMIAGFVADDASVQWAIIPIGNGSNVVTNIDFNLRRGATGMDVAGLSGLSMTSAIFNSGIHQLVFEYEESPDGTKFTQRVYLDGLLIATRPGVAVANAFYSSSLAGTAKIGCPSSYAGGTLTGNFRRAWFQDLTLSNRSLIDMVKLDWSVSKTRMGV